MPLQATTRGGTYLRVAEPDWDNPLDASYCGREGGRWNAPDTGDTLYLNATREVARRNVARKFLGLPYGPEDLSPGAAPVLVSCELADAEYADVVSDAGVEAAGLPASYPLRSDGTVVPHSDCHAVGADARSEQLAGVACRSAAPGASGSDEELAVFVENGTRLSVSERLAFEDWFWNVPK